MISEKRVEVAELLIALLVISINAPFSRLRNNKGVTVLICLLHDEIHDQCRNGANCIESKQHAVSQVEVRWMDIDLCADDAVALYEHLRHSPGSTSLRVTPVVADSEVRGQDHARVCARGYETASNYLYGN